MTPYRSSKCWNSTAVGTPLYLLPPNGILAVEHESLDIESGDTT